MKLKAVAEWVNAVGRMKYTGRMTCLPCAIGAIINDKTIEQLKCKIIRSG